MNFRKTVRSTYQHQSQHQSLKKIEFNPDDLKECNNLYNEQAQSTKQSESNSILNRLLLQPPSMKQNSQKKLSLMQNKKYEPKFQKPDVQNVIQQNINLKNIIQTNNHTISTLKVKNIELEKKIKLLQKGLEKFQKKVFAQEKGRKQQQTNKQEKQNEILKGSVCNNNQERILGHTVSSSSFGKIGTVHTQILKKKISQLTLLNMSAQNELKFLKKLPNVTIYEQNDVQKQHLMAQTIRLKSIITSLSQQLHQLNQNEQNEKFQNQFMRLMKQENEKLKATVRLLQNDKILLKSRQAIMNKLNSDLKKQIQQLKSKLLYKQSQLQKLNNENKNLLFKKTNQYRLQQQKKQNEIIVQLRQKLTNVQNEKFKLEQSNEFYNDQNISLKQKQKLLQQQITQLQTKYQTLIKKLNQQNQQLQFQLKNLKNDYINLMNANSLKKKKSVAIMMQSTNANQPKRESAFSLANSKNAHGNRNSSQFQQQQIQSQNNQHNHISNFNNFNKNSNISLKRQKSFNQYNNLPNKQLTYVRPVKWQQIQLPLTHLYVTLQQNTFQSIDHIIENISQDNKIKCGDLISLFVDQPFNINKKQATKLARYIVEEQTSGNQRVVFDQNAATTTSMAKRILLISLEKINEKLSNTYDQKWRIIFDRTRKLISTIKQWLEDKKFVKKQEFMQIVDRNSRQKVLHQDYEYLCTKCFDKVHSEEEFTLDKIAILQWIDDLTLPKPKKSQTYFNILIQ